jgi:Ribbon-helix-helix domain
VAQKADEPIRRISVFLTERQLAALRGINKRTGIPVAFLIRRGVDWIIQQHTGRRRARQ